MHHLDFTPRGRSLQSSRYNNDDDRCHNQELLDAICEHCVINCDCGSSGSCTAVGILAGLVIVGVITSIAFVFITQCAKRRRMSTPALISHFCSSCSCPPLPDPHASTGHAAGMQPATAFGVQPATAVGVQPVTAVGVQPATMHPVAYASTTGAGLPMAAAVPVNQPASQVVQGVPVQGVPVGPAV